MLPSRWAVLSPRFLPIHVLAIVLVALAGWLGSWQYSAWQADRSAQSTALARGDSAQPAVPLAEVFGPDDPFPGLDNGRPVEVVGEWLPGSAFLVADRESPTQPAQPGYWAVASVAVGGPSGAALPVVLGWVERPSEAPDAVTGPVRLVGWLQQPEGVPSRPDPDPNDEVVPTLRIAEVVQRLDRDVYGGFVIARTPDELAPGLSAVAPGVGRDADWSTGARNLFYAGEWWFFGGFVVFAWWRYLRDELAEQGHTGET